jgi:caa(3)-type oxidase subunit IV
MNLRAPIFLYAGNMILLGLVLLVTLVVPSPATPYAIAIFALTQGVLILLVGMELRRDSSLMHLFAGIAGMWLSILLVFTMFDYLTR